MLVRGMGWEALRRERSFDLLFLLGTLILPLLAALPLKIAGFDPMDTTTPGILRSLAFVFPLLILAVAAGYWWKRSIWLAHAALFYGIFALFYTTIFSYPEGLATGWMGALSYWMAQQAVNRGGQPWFYYAFLLVPVYEFLPALGAIAAAIIGWRRGLWTADPERPFEKPQPVEQAEPAPESLAEAAPSPEPLPEAPAPAPATPTLALLIYWSVSSLLAFTLAGEKMPWLTVDIALPLILASGWALGYWIETWNVPRPRPWLRSIALVVFTLLAVLTFRTAFRAAYINYDNAMEYLVYAHAAADPKFVLAQIEDISRRTTDGLDIVVAYDNDTRYPYWWYLRHYPNRIDYDVNPTRELQKAAIILVGEDNYAKVEPIVGNDYLVFNYMRLWWPNQDYWRLKWDEIDAERNAGNAPGAPALPPMSVFEYFARVWGHIRPFFTNPAVRSAVWQIWLNRDYTQYAALQKSTTFTLANWQPSNRMRMYLRKDVAAQIWGSGAVPAAPTVAVDPYAAVTVQVAPEKTIGAPGSSEGQFQSPRAIAVASDGSLYVADSRNNRIQHLTAEGRLINAWGSFADVSKGAAPGGTFNEPWGIALGPDGSVYVSDTWNHRVEKFTPAGQFVTMWGHFGQAETPDAFWGPRGIAVDPAGRVYVVDTGNKRVVIFDSSGKAIAQFGQAGADPGQFDEPVGIALDADGKIFVADTWNQRVQVFNPDFTNDTFSPVAQFTVEGWYGQSLENKPFIAVDGQGRIYVTDPEGARVLEFTPGGAILKVWGLSGGGGSSLPSGIALDSRGALWMSDASQQRLEEYNNPASGTGNKQ
jgi:DNA-binding beta-propeller fold protein YncE